MKIAARDVFEQIRDAFYAVSGDHSGKLIKQSELKGHIAMDWLSRNASTNGLVSNEAQCILITMDVNESTYRLKMLSSSFQGSISFTRILFLLTSNDGS